MQTLITHLTTGHRAFLDELHAMSPDQWSARALPDGWSIFEITEHVATVEIGICTLLSEKLFERPCSPEQKLQVARKDALVVDVMKDRTVRRLAPDMVNPTGRWPTPAEALAAFDRTRRSAIELLLKETRDLRNYCAAHPSLKTLDGYQWVLFMISHADRHREQIREIKSGPGFSAAW